METVYHLKDDATGIAHMQRGATTPGPIGLRITHGLVGSPGWWSQIQSEALPLQTECGVVSGFWIGQNGGGPAEFEVRQVNGETSRWLCELEPVEASKLFLLGRPVVVQYVTQELKTAFNGNLAAKVTVSISLG